MDPTRKTNGVRRMIETLRSVMVFDTLELDPVKRRLRRAASIADLRTIARRRLPRGVFDYIDGGAEDERTMQANSEAYAKVTFAPRVLRDMTHVDPSTTLLGDPLPIPLVLAPTGFTRIAHPEGEIAVARSAARAGLPYSLSSLSTRSIEQVASAGSGQHWFQVYMWRDRGLVRELIDRAFVSGFKALVLTVDTVVLGRRERDVRHGFTLPPKLGPKTLIDGALHPAWTWSFVRSDPILFANVEGRDVGDGSNAVALADFMNTQFDATLSWADVEWLQSLWSGPIVIKGIQTVADAELAARAGVAAIAISNHGGRQLDGSPATLDLVDAVANAVGDRLEIICDGGVRRGSDIVKAVAKGARCLHGRPGLPLRPRGRR